MLERICQKLKLLHSLALLRHAALMRNDKKVSLRSGFCRSKIRFSNIKACDIIPLRAAGRRCVCGLLNFVRD
jgi:hypothetical protein